MRTRAAGLVAAALFMLGVAACNKAAQDIGLAHVINDDGNDKGNPNGSNPGTLTLTLDVIHASVQVGDTIFVGATYSGNPNPGNGNDWANFGTSDSSIVAITFVNLNNVMLTARSVGYANVTAHYLTTVATPAGVTVAPKNGISALASIDTTVQGWIPPAFHIVPGASAQFNVGTTHSVAFDSVAGAPADIAMRATGQDQVRAFPVAGTFHYHCTVHGEAGVVVVTP